jgi:small redox-active disulfide protein 2
MKFTIYGSGCSKCQQLASNAKQSAKSLGLSYEIVKVTDINSIIDADVMNTPALSIDGEMMFEGKVASVDEIMERLT